MKQFNLEEYIKNPSRKVVTREGRKARIICTDRKNNEYPVVALVEDTLKGGGESIYFYTKAGNYHTYYQSDNDLFFDTDHHEGWINIYKNDDTHRFFGGVYESKEEAENRKDHGFVTSIKIKLGE